MKPTLCWKWTRNALVVAFVALGALACDSAGGGDDCPDIVVTPGCKLRCTRTVAENNTQKVCSKSLMLTGQGTNEILQKKTKRIQFKSLPKETCFPISGAALADADDQQKLQKACEAP